MSIPHPTKTKEWKDGNTPATGTLALGSSFNAEFDQLYENDNGLETNKLDKAGGTVTGSLIIQQDLTVQGNVVQVDTVNLEVKDKVITLNDGEPGPGVSGDGLSGVEVDRGTGQDKANLVFDESDDQWKAGLGGALLPLLRLLAGNKISLDELIEKTLDHGITVDGVLLKDGSIIESNNITVTSASQQMENNKVYLVNYTGGRCSLTLPSTGNVGDTIRIIDIGGGGYNILQNADQNIIYMNQSTIPGTVGKIWSKTGFSSIKLLCTVANITWQAVEIRDQYVMKGYCMGGASTTVIEDLNFSTEVSVVIAATLDTAKYAGIGVSSNLKGYHMGGNTGSATAVIEDLNFSTEASVVIAATLDTAKYGGIGVSSNLKGYCMGGTTGSATAVIEDLNFSTEASVVIAATLDTAKYIGAGVSSNLKGYCMGGNTGSTTAVIEDLNFSTEASVVIAATLDTAKYGGIGVSFKPQGLLYGWDHRISHSSY